MSWTLGEYDDTLGYDCMTGGIHAGPAVLDGSDYGQKRCRPITPGQLALMMADARLIAAAPDLLAALKPLTGDRLKSIDKDNMEFRITLTCYEVDAIRAAIAKAEA